MKSPRSKEELCSRVADGWSPKYVYFWNHTSAQSYVGRECLSQWYPSPFQAEGVEFPTAEHFMMYSKAHLFGDEESSRAILSSSHPGEAKRLGRAVLGFQEDVWVERRWGIVLEGNLAKFEQNMDLRSYLLRTGSRVLVEASPRDHIWGVGFSEKDVDVLYPDRWSGQNLLGFILMEVRDTLSEG